ncbi:DUF4070 domain-containing protein, partial [candidate division KSB3 bacterium]|nr:DUF4070 domain-containing protein [candidate division KSB3 bacterium]
AIIAFNDTLKFPLQYMTQVSIDLAKDEELLQLFYEARMTKVFIGIETPRKASLQETNKHQNARTDLVADVKKIQSYNIGVSAGMIVGFDHDDPAIFQEQFDFIMETDIAWAMTGILQAVPKTPLYERLKKENRLDLSTKSFELNNTALDVNIIPKNMTKEELVHGYTWLLRQLYSYENYAKRVIGNIKAYTKAPAIKFYVPKVTQFKIIFRTLRYYLLTLDSKRRKFSWDILKYTLLHKPFALYDVMVHLVSFKHLHSYVYEYLEDAVNQKAAQFAVWEHSLSERAGCIVSTQTGKIYEELRKQAAAASAQAAAVYDELCKQSTATSQHARGRYEELHQQAAVLRAQTAAVYEELLERAPSASQQAASRYDDLRAHVAKLSQQIAATYEDLSQQAAALSQQAAGVSKHVAAGYQELANQATLARNKAAALGEELKKTMHLSSIQVARER